MRTNTCRTVAAAAPTLAACLLALNVAGQNVRPGAPAEKTPVTVPPTTVAPTPPPAAAPTMPTRLDFAMAQWRLDHWITDHAPTGALANRVSMAWDQSIELFFKGPHAQSLASMNEALVIAQNAPATADQQRLLCSLRVRMTPPVLVLDQAPQVSARLGSVYAVAGAFKSPLGCRLQVIAANGSSLLEAPFDLEVNAKGEVNQSVKFDLTGKTLPPGSYWVQMQPPAGPAVVVTRWTVVPRSLSAVRADQENLLNQITQTDSSLVAAFASARARNDLLTDLPSEDYTVYLLLDLEQLSREVSQEVKAITAGKDPYLRKPGDTWRVLAFGDYQHRYRVYAPAAACAQTPVPLVITLNQISGDENLFFDLYGNGELKKQADQHGFVAVAAQLSTFAINPANVNALIDEMARCYPIDRGRVYLVGHAKGAEVVNRWMLHEKGMFTAACMISSGAGFIGAASIPPSLVIAGEADGLVPASQLEQSCKEALKAGLPVTFLSYPGCGHSSVIGEAMPDIAQWLMQQKAVHGQK